MFWLKLSPYHPRLLWVNYNRPGGYLVIIPSNHMIIRVPLGEGGSWILDQLHLEGLDSWTVEQQQSAKILLVESADVFSKNDLDLGKSNILKHAIKITDPQPFKERYQRIPPHLYEEVKNHLQEMVEVGAIRRSFSPWASAVVLVRKKMGA